MHTQQPQLWDIAAHAQRSCHSCGTSLRMRSTAATHGCGMSPCMRSTAVAVVGLGAQQQQHATAVTVVGCICVRKQVPDKTFEIPSILLRPPIMFEFTRDRCLPSSIDFLQACSGQTCSPLFHIIGSYWDAGAICFFTDARHHGGDFNKLAFSKDSSSLSEHVNLE